LNDFILHWKSEATISVTLWTTTIHSNSSIMTPPGWGDHDHAWVWAETCHVAPLLYQDKIPCPWKIFQLPCLAYNSLHNSLHKTLNKGWQVVPDSEDLILVHRENLSPLIRYMGIQSITDHRIMDHTRIWTLSLSLDKIPHSINQITP